MGGASSVLTKADVSKKLSVKGMREFDQFEEQCKNVGMTDMEIYNFMTIKYEELLKKESDSPFNDPSVQTLAETISENNSMVPYSLSQSNSLNSESFLNMIVSSLSTDDNVDKDALAKELTAAFNEIDQNNSHEDIDDSHAENVLSSLFPENNKSFTTVNEIETTPFCCTACNIEFESAERQAA